MVPDLPAFIVLRSGGASLVLETASGTALPAVVHWGADLGSLGRQALGDLVAAGIAPVAPNMPDAPVRLALLPEAHTAWTGAPGLAGSRSGADWSPRFSLIRVEHDGTVEAGVVTASQVVFEAEDHEAALGLTLTVEMLASGLVRARAALTNHGEGAYAVDALNLGFPVPARAREILDFAGRWTNERVPQRTTLGVGCHRREGRHGRTGADSAYLLHLGVPGFGFGAGEVWAVHTAWSGNHVHYAERVYDGAQVIGGGELLLPGEVRLGRGETYEAPWLYAAYGDGLDAVADRFHAWLRGRPEHPDARRPVTLNVWEAVYFDHDLGKLTALADLAASLGVERFVLDDGWFGSRRDDTSGLGDWWVAPDVWPDGLGPLVDHATGLGMQFGLWFEPEMVNPDSELARAHPDWIMQPGHGRLPVESRHQQVLNIGIPACYAHIRDAVDAVLSAYDIAYVKWDHNRDLVDAGTAPDGRPAVHAQTLAYYRLVDELKARHPGLEIESCSSGGARIDLEAVARTDRVWVSDCIDPHERMAMMRWTQQLIPAELCGSHIASGRSHTTGRTHELSFRAASAIWGHLGIEWDLTKASDDELTQLRDWIAWYKANRELLLRGRLVRVDQPEESLFVHGVVTPERALFACTALDAPATVSVGRVVLPGLEPDAHYRVSVERTEAPIGAPWSTGSMVMTGRALAQVGVRTPYLVPDQMVIWSATRL